MKETRDFEYNANFFTLKLEEAAFSLSKIYSYTPIETPLFPLIPDMNKENLFKYMMCKNKIDSSIFDANLCVDIYKEFFADYAVEKHLSNTKNEVDLLLNKLNALTNESVLIKSALLNYEIVNASIFPTQNREIADILSVVYLYKHNLLPTPYFYLNCREQFEKIYDAGEMLDGYIFVFLTLVSQQAERHVEYLRNVAQLKEEISATVYSVINRPQSDRIVRLIFETPILTADDMSKELGITRGQAVRYLHVLEETGVLIGDDKQRNRTFYFARLLGFCFNLQ